MGLGIGFGKGNGKGKGKRKWEGEGEGKVKGEGEVKGEVEGEVEGERGKDTTHVFQILRWFLGGGVLDAAFWALFFTLFCSGCSGFGLGLV